MARRTWEKMIWCTVSMKVYNKPMNLVGSNVYLSVEIEIHFQKAGVRQSTNHMFLLNASNEGAY